MEKVILFLAATLLLSFLTFNLRPVLAHEEMVIGNVRIVTGWVNEPPLVNQLNGIVVTITNVSNDQPINNALAQLDITVNKGTENKSLDFQPTEEAGVYAATLLPTQTGQYTAVMRGMIAGQAIDAQIEIEDVEDTAGFIFPPASTSTSSSNQIPQELVEQLQTVITDLTTQVEEANVASEDAYNATQSITESVEELKMSADRAYLFSMIGVGAGVAGIAIGVVALSRKEKIR
jgi:hypothetical protein